MRLALILVYAVHTDVVHIYDWQEWYMMALMVYDHVCHMIMYLQK